MRDGLDHMDRDCADVTVPPEHTRFISGVPPRFGIAPCPRISLGQRRVTNQLGGLGRMTSSKLALTGRSLGVLCVASVLAGVLLQSRGWQLPADWSLVMATPDAHLPPVCRIGKVVGLFLPDECASTAR